MLIALACTGFGAILLWTWWCEMFSDNLIGQMGRAMEDAFDLWKNSTSITHPAGALAFFIGGIGMIIDAADGPELLIDIFVLGSLPLLAIAVLGIIPVQLPDWMYPIPREQERQRRRAAAEQEPQSKRAADARVDLVHAEPPSPAATDSQPRSTHMSPHIRLEAPPDWRTIAADQLPEGALGEAIRNVQLIITRPPSTPRFAPNLVVLRFPIDDDSEPEATVAASRDALVRDTPGLLLIEDAPWPRMNSTWSGAFRTGVYILDEDSLTLIQWAWVHTDEDGPALWTATFSCLTDEYPDLSETALDMASTMEVE